MDNIQIIENLSESIVLLDQEDKQALGAIHNLFEQLSKNLDEAQLDTIIQNTLALIETLILDETDNPDHEIEVLSKTISAFQQLIGEEMPFSKINFPDKITGSDSVGPSSIPDETVDSEIFSEFLSKQESVLQEMESLLIELEKSNQKKDWDALKAILHTMKGESAMIGLADVEKKCHNAEDLILEEAPEAHINELFELKDWLANTFSDFSEQSEAPDESEPVETEAEETAKSDPPERQDIEDAELLADFINEAQEHIETLDQELLNIESDVTNSDSLNSLFRAFHTIKGVAGFLNLDDIRELSHASEDLLDSARKGKMVLENIIIDVVFEAVDKLKELLAGLSSGLAEGKYPPRDQKVPQLIEHIRQLTADALAGKTETGRDYSTPAEEGPARQFSPNKPEDTSPDTKTEGKPAPATSPKKPGKVKLKETLKIDALKLDRLVDTIGELVIAESMISQSEYVEKIESLSFEKKLNRLDKITRELQEMGLSLRMVPVRSTFQKMARLVRDLSRKSNKPVEFIMTGKDTELDKSVVEKIADPLVHLLRNAVDHGIETPRERKSTQKPARGKVELRAFHKSGKIFIEVEDDGRGLDRERIIKKALEQGVINSADNLSDREIWNLIFEPGFSTAQKVTDVSGRGVGMDVVRKNIASLRGKIQIDSQQGKGSIFTIQLPLTLAIIDGMIISLADERFIIPTLSVVTSLRINNGELSTVTNKGEVIQFQDELVPIYRLKDFFNIKDARDDISKSIVVIVESEGKRIGLVADTLLGQQQIVIKSLSETLQNVPGIAGGAIMPDGMVALILDIGGMAKLSRKKAKKSTVSADKCN